MTSVNLKQNEDKTLGTPIVQTPKKTFSQTQYIPYNNNRSIINQGYNQNNAKSYINPANSQILTNDQIYKTYNNNVVSSTENPVINSKFNEQKIYEKQSYLGQPINNQMYNSQIGQSISGQVIKDPTIINNKYETTIEGHKSYVDYENKRTFINRIRRVVEIPQEIIEVPIHVPYTVEKKVEVPYEVKFQ